MKNLKLIAFTIVAMLITVTNVYAKEVGNATDLLDCVTEEGICTLTSNIDLADRLVIETEKNIVLDLNGKTLNVNKILENNYSVFVKGNLTVQGNGTINIANEYGIGVTGTLTIKNGTFNHEEGTYLIGNWGTTTIENGTYNADYCAVNGFSGTTVIKNGTFSSNPYPSYGEDENVLYYWGILFDETNGAKLEVQKGTFNQVLTWANILADNAEVKYILEQENLLYDPVEIKGNVTIDLNGQTISFDENSIDKNEDSVFTVLRGGKLIINDSKELGKIEAGNSGKIYAAIKLTKKGESATGNVAEVIVNGGTIEGYYYGIVGNGSRHNTKITINNGIIKGNCDTALGIFHPQNGELVVNGGTITGTTGIEMRAGTLTVNSGNITGTGKPTEFNPNGSGSSSYGAGIAISQHTTALETKAIIKGGIINGYSAVYQATVETTNDPSKISLTISGGNFNAINDGTVVIESEDKSSFISGGTYSHEPNAKYITSPYEAEKDGNIYKIILVSEEVSADSTIIDTKEEFEEVTPGIAEKDKEDVNNTLLESLEENKSLIAGADTTDKVVVKLEIEKDTVSDQTKELFEDSEEAEKLTIVEYFDATVNVYVEDTYKGSIPELTKNVKITVMLPENLQEVEKGYTRTFYLIREHNGKIETIKAELSKDGKFITAESNKFSTYAVAYEDVILPPQTGDNIITHFIMTIVSLIAIAGIVLVSKKQFN